VAAARRSHQAGFDGVELHAAHLYLLSAFISPYTNRRNDDYGGDITNRCRFTREIIEDIKTAVGTDFPVWVRLNGCEALEPGLSLKESRQAAVIFAEAGADAVHVSAYTIPAKRKVKTGLTIPVGGGPGKDIPHGVFLDYAGAIKEAVNIPVVAVGKLDDVSLAEEALAQGKCDMIALGRQLLCDPYWAQKVKEGREKEIVHCDYCDTCHVALHNGREIVCAQNLNLYDKPSYKKRS
jgi:2,4-dienoyl-CoA reductase-like NADH-dependent reductase (Old Yellow Enzyme family)